MKLKEFERCPAVTTGGKPFFYYHAATRLAVAWDRISGLWVAKGPTGLSRAGATPSAALRAWIRADDHSIACY